MDYKKFKFTKDHEWLNLQEDLATVGITDYAQSQLGDIVFVEMPELSVKLTASESFGAIEAVKTVADLFAPVSGKVIEINENLDSNPDLVNSDPYTKGWIVKLKIENNDEINELMNYDEYQEYSLKDS
ncbi:MAG: glycine cleavage system protein GcvH [bacterium TMED144]|nr:MAG: glycine cleavage system protein GcvH [bacterium TMED144]|tara:strand:+ start:2868 stop:3251 length:384 start_codon:yes stop_codon:yes gene_type:complete